MPPSRRTALRLCAVALAGSVAGCTSGTLDEESGETATDEATTDETATDATADATTHSLGVDTSLPEGSVTLPEGPKSRPERPADLTAESVRAFVAAFERRWVYNELYRGESSSVHQTCGVESVREYGEGYRVVARCTAWVNSGTGETTVHADYFTQYATYFVGENSTVRREGRAETRG
ncbi:hypothetical protein M0R88_18470 [Halorussus gelatinilyticus]|uniref:Lipoprotein n=1 Tax=Halorussus gelatinilyticus TaxID=2937524 RepID=A0A8U0IHK1_9EURY|nr:hypothetical protein [Halorussus gelatinilyticus]UPW00473.1 hypothetical protein M0R88_18470 [Halorussus gelatinilyticus]